MYLAKRDCWIDDMPNGKSYVLDSFCCKDDDNCWVSAFRILFQYAKPRSSSVPSNKLSQSVTWNIHQCQTAYKLHRQKLCSLRCQHLHHLKKKVLHLFVDTSFMVFEQILWSIHWMSTSDLIMMQLVKNSLNNDVTVNTSFSEETRNVGQCSNTIKTRTLLKFAGVPQTRQQISAASGPKFTILWHVGEVLLFSKFFPDCRYVP